MATLNWIQARVGTMSDGSSGVQAPESTGYGNAAGSGGSYSGFCPSWCSYGWAGAPSLGSLSALPSRSSGHGISWSGSAGSRKRHGLWRTARCMSRSMRRPGNFKSVRCTRIAMSCCCSLVKIDMYIEREWHERDSKPKCMKGERIINWKFEELQEVLAESD